MVIIEEYTNSLNTVKDYIINLLKFYEWFNDNQTNINTLINYDKPRVDDTTINKFYMNLPFRIKQLKDTIKKSEEISQNFPEKLNPQFENLLNKELLTFNSRDYYLISNYWITKLEVLKERIYDRNPFVQSDYDVLDALAGLIIEGQSLEDKLISIISSIDTFNEIQDIENNIVIIGANGSGKSRFARNLNGKLSSAITIISAQKLLVFNNPSNINVNQSMIDNVRNFQRTSKLSSDGNFSNLIANDLQNLIVALLEEKLNKATKYYETDKKEVSLLDKTIQIWEELITHRKIIHDGNYKIYIETPHGSKYKFNELSDGEKAVFYYIGHVLLAEQKSYILIDEPENHLHLSICNKLWDKLELTRPDCKFIYITHDIDFAVSRNQKTLIWNKSYSPPFNWDFEIVKENKEIPEVLMLEIMGSRRAILFCEGDDRNSLDYKIYSRLFDTLNVIPVRGHEEVIKYTTALKNTPLVNGLEAYGIIDGDAWTDEEKDGMRKNNIFVLPFNEIENLICQEKILNKVVELAFGKKEDVELFIEEFFKVISKEKEKISVWYANNRINNYLKRNLFKEIREIDRLKNEVEEFLQKEKIEEYYNEMLSRIERDIEMRDYNSLIKYVNSKNILTRALANKHIVDNFEERFINMIDNNEDFRSFLKRKVVEYIPDLKKLAK